jgi:thiamine biosynthesis lipoprotein
MKPQSELTEARSEQRKDSRESFRVRSQPFMGTLFTVYLHDVEAAQQQAVFQMVFDEIERVEKTFSRFLPSSELARINREAALGPLVTDPEVFRLLARARDLSEKTEGAFDATVGPLTRAWGFAERKRSIPSTEALQAAQEAVEWRQMHLDEAWRTVEFGLPGMELDLGAIAKGYALDCALELLQPLSIQAMIDAGSSSIAACGDFFSRAWPVAIADPVRPGETLCEVQLGHRALSTSGVKEQSFTAEGRIYSHLLDPAPLFCEEGSNRLQLLQTTVLAPDSTLADGLSTALFLLGPHRGKAVLERFPQTSVFWVCRQDQEIFTSALHWPATTANT